MSTENTFYLQHREIINLLPSRILLYLIFLFMPQLASANTIFGCDPSAFVINGKPWKCEFLILAQPENNLLELVFQVEQGQQVSFSENLVGRRYCVRYVDPLSTSNSNKEDDFPGCNGAYVYEFNNTFHMPDPLPAGSAEFICGFLELPCIFLLSDEKTKIELDKVGSKILPIPPGASEYCSISKKSVSTSDISFLDCKLKNGVTAISDRNEMWGRTTSDAQLRQWQAKARLPENPLSRVPKNLLADNALIDRCIISSNLSTPAAPAFFSLSFKQGKTLRATMPYILPTAEEKAQLSKLCDGRWILLESSADGNDVETAIKDPNFGTVEDLNKPIEIQRIKTETIANGYYLHIKTTTTWYLLYQEFQAVAKVTKTSDFNSEQVLPERLVIGAVFDSGENATPKSNDCGKSSYCEISNKMYYSTIFKPIDFCAKATSILNGIQLYAGVPTNKACPVHVDIN